MGGQFPISGLIECYLVCSSGRLREVQPRHLCTEDFPIIRSRRENETHSVHPGALFAGEKCIPPYNISDEQLACFCQRCFDNVTFIFLCVRSKQRFKAPPNFFAIPPFSRSIDELRILCEKRNQFF